jgi:hypothetical protein
VRRVLVRLLLVTLGGSLVVGAVTAFLRRAQRAEWEDDGPAPDEFGAGVRAYAAREADASPSDAAAVPANASSSPD